MPLPAVVLLLAACSPPPAGESAPEVVAVPQAEGCDNLNDLLCALPFPSDRYLAEDPSTATGYRLAYTPQVIPVNSAGLTGETFDFAPYEALDGMSPASRIFTLFATPADLAASGAATQDDIGRSLDADSPTVIYDLTAGVRVAHWVENDARTQDPSETLLYLNPASRLDDDHSYVVAVRGLVDADGGPLVARPAFEAVRDGLHTDAPDVEARWARLDAAMTRLDDAGVARDTLQAAWTFHTASTDALTRDLLAMRDDASERLGPGGVGCTVTSVEEDYGADDGYPVYRRVRGTYTVPSYMEAPGPGHRLARDAEGRPTFVGWDEAPFTVLVPYSLTTPAPHAGRLLTYGHGLLGSGERTVSSPMFRYVAERTGMVVVATDWWGMSDEDEPTVAGALYDLSDFVQTTDRLHQGIINFIALSRSFAGVCRTLPELVVDDTPLVDDAAPYFAGGSQGGILGGTLLAIHPDVSRGVLMVNGAVFPFMIERSIDFVPLQPVFDQWYPRRIDQAMLLPLTQHLWDHTEPEAYLPHLRSGLGGGPGHEVLSIVAKNDQQVNNLASDMAARMMGLPVIRGSAREPWGLDVVDAADATSGYLAIDLGDRPPPTGNTPADFNDEGHSTICWEESCLQLIDAFLRDDGRVTMPCDGECDPN